MVDSAVAVPILEETAEAVSSQSLRKRHSSSQHSRLSPRGVHRSDEDQVRHLNHARAPPRQVVGVHVPLEESSHYGSIDL
ncbi:unnamed protein product [Boreogadus saida]